MSGFKIKDLDIKTIYYDIIVSVNGNTHKVSHTYAEFDAIHNAIKNSCSTEGFPPERIPEFPSFRMANISTDKKTLLLGEYLKSLCSQNLFSSELLEFLKIEGKIRESILKYTHKMYEAGNNDSVHISESALIAYYEPAKAIEESLTLSTPTYHLN